MKILYVVHSFPPFHWRGTEVYALELALALAERHQVRLFHLRHDPEAKNPSLESDTFRGLAVHRSRQRVDPVAPQTYFFHPGQEAVFAELLNSHRPEVVHFLYYTGGLSLGLVPLAARMTDRVFLTATDFSGPCPRGQLLDEGGRPCPGPRQALRCVPCLFGQNVFVRSPGWDRFFRERWPASLVRTGSKPELGLLRKRLAAARAAFKTARAVIYPNRNALLIHRRAGFQAGTERIMDYGIDTSRFAGHQKRPAPSPRIGFVGQLLPHKGLHVLAKALAGLPGQWRLLVYGWLEDPGSREYYDSLGLDPGRTEFKGSFPFERMNAVLEEVDVLVVPSQWQENCPLIVKYALATGTPAVLADQPGMVAERAGIAGARFFPAADPDALREALAAALAETAGRREPGESSARPTSKAVIDVHDQAVELAKIYEED